MPRDPIVLAYHSVHPTRRGPLTVHPSDFERQIEWLVRCGLSSTTLDTKLQALHHSQPPVGKQVVITFDDGYEDNLRFAQPILQRYGFTGTVFVVASLVNTNEILEPDLSVAQYGGKPSNYQILSWDEVLALVDSGWQVGSHTMTHPHLTTIDASRVRWEISESKAVIEDKIERPVNTFCYPAGHYNSDIMEEVRLAGYHGAVATPRARVLTDTPYSMLRIGVYRHDSLTTFRLKLNRSFAFLRGMPLLWNINAGLSWARRQFQGK